MLARRWRVPINLTVRGGCEASAAAPQPDRGYCTMILVPSDPIASPAFRSPQDSPR